MTPDLYHVDEFPAGCLVTDRSGRVVFANRYIETAFGFDTEALVSASMDMMFTYPSRLLLESHVYPALRRNDQTEELLLTLLGPSDRRIPVVVYACIHGRDDSLVTWVIIRAEKRHQLHDALMRARDVFEDRANQLRKLAATDELTGLFNRREFLSRAGVAFRNAGLAGTSVSILMADIDLFKRINDTHGHAAGDEVLRAVGEAFQEACRSGELVARYGGEEFVFCIEGLSPSATARFAQRMHEAVAGVPTPGDPLSISIGIGMRFGGTQTTLLESLRDADRALYAAKQAGRNRTFIAEGERLTDLGAG
jgi:diguanylate cyclase (GGDEF)-like protein